MNEFYINTLNTLTKLDCTKPYVTNIYWLWLSPKLNSFTHIIAFHLYKWMLVPQVFILMNEETESKAPCGPANIMSTLCVHVHVYVTVGQSGFWWKAETTNKGVPLTRRQEGCHWNPQDFLPGTSYTALFLNNISLLEHHIEILWHNKNQNEVLKWNFFSWLLGFGIFWFSLLSFFLWFLFRSLIF